MKKSLFSSFLILSLIYICTGCQSDTVKKQSGKMNVLFIAIDDLRPELNCYGGEHIKSPHIDALAKEAALFERAYCNVPVCGASRASLLTGILPTRDRFVTYYTRADEDTPDAVTLPEHFKNNGYHTVSLGKIFHNAGDNETKAWSQPPLRYDHFRIDTGNWGDKGWQNYITNENKIIAYENENGYAKAWESADVHDSAYFDGKVANRAVEYLNEMSQMDQPFFLGVGFLKPHLPFNAPKKYWDMYPLEDIKLPGNMYFPESAPEAAHHNWGELRAYTNIPKTGQVADSLALKLIQGYSACVSYADALVGKVLNTLEELGLKENTIVVLWGDHGWSLGEHGLWCKHSNFNNVLQTPLIVRVPGFEKNIRVTSLVEFVDIYPTLCELTDLKKPLQLQGQSFMNVLQGETTSKPEVFPRWIEGESIKTDQYLYTEWIDDQGSTYARMLYDHTKDPVEMNNLASSADYEDVVNELSEKIHENMMLR